MSRQRLALLAFPLLVLLLAVAGRAHAQEPTSSTLKSVNASPTDILAGTVALPDPAAQDLRAALHPPGAAFVLGTDHLGRSVLARVAQGLRLSLALAVVAVGLAAALGVALGLLAAASGGWVDRALAALGDATLALPGLLLVLVVVVASGGGGGACWWWRVIITIPPNLLSNAPLPTTEQ